MHERFTSRYRGKRYSFGYPACPNLEDQAKQLDEWHTRLAADTERLTRQKKDQELTVSQVEQRAAVLIDQLYGEREVVSVAAETA